MANGRPEIPPTPAQQAQIDRLVNGGMDPDVAAGMVGVMKANVPPLVSVQPQIPQSPTRQAQPQPVPAMRPSYQPAPSLGAPRPPGIPHANPLPQVGRIAGPEPAPVAPSIIPRDSNKAEVIVLPDGSHQLWNPDDKEWQQIRPPNS